MEMEIDREREREYCIVVISAYQCAVVHCKASPYLLLSRISYSNTSIAYDDHTDI